MGHRIRGFKHSFSRQTSLINAAAVSSIADCELTPPLEKVCRALSAVPDDKLRYQQLLYLASKAKPMSLDLKTDINKVPGCLSVVHVHATLTDDGKVAYSGDSDSQLTKGIVTLLVNGLSGHTSEEIQKVNPEFIRFAGIGASLTPGRNNGFLNMLNMMKTQARSLSTTTSSSSSSSSSSTASDGAGKATELKDNAPSARPIYDSMLKKLALLKPVELMVEDESHKHAGHAGMQGIKAVESHFKLRIIADCFEGLGLVQRHKMIYTILDSEMKSGIHALSIYAKTSNEEKLNT